MTVTLLAPVDAARSVAEKCLPAAMSRVSEALVRRRGRGQVGVAAFPYPHAYVDSIPFRGLFVRFPHRIEEPYASLPVDVTGHDFFVRHCRALQ